MTRFEGEIREAGGCGTILVGLGLMVVGTVINGLTDGNDGDFGVALMVIGAFVFMAGFPRGWFP